VQDRGESDPEPKAERAAWPDLDTDGSATKAAKQQDEVPVAEHIAHDECLGLVRAQGVLDARE